MKATKEEQKQQGRNLLKVDKNQKGRNGEPIWQIAERKADAMICHEGIDRAERIAVLILERIQAVKADLKAKYPGG